jgi:parallel beta-helix repeat protein
MPALDCSFESMVSVGCGDFISRRERNALAAVWFAFSALAIAPPTFADGTHPSLLAGGDAPHVVVAAAALPAAVPAPVPAANSGSAGNPYPPVIPCTGVQITPGYTADAIQQLVDSNPAGTVFCFASGVYVLTHYITMKDRNQFICPVRRTCVLTGLDQYRGALAADFGTQAQLIKGFVVEHFVSLPGVWPNAGLQVRDLGVIEDNETRFNRIGISVASNQTLRSNFIHHNQQYGIAGGPSYNVLITGNELAWNNTLQLDPGNDAGGSKIVGSQSGSNWIFWRNNHVHDNYGQGIWSDGNVRNAFYEGNLIENNGGAGIDHEISWNAVIRNNILRNNNTLEQGQGRSCWYGAQITLNNSQNVTIASNTIEAAGTNAICVANTTRMETAAFPQLLANIIVTGNVIRMRGAVFVGVAGDSLPPNVAFSGNWFYVDNPANAYWLYGAGPLTFQQWQAAGQDATGRLFLWQ